MFTIFSAKTQTFCGFEDKSICGFTQDNQTDNFDWTRARVQTPSGGTGPNGDHTCGPRTVGNIFYNIHLLNICISGFFFLLINKEVIL